MESNRKPVNQEFGKFTNMWKLNSKQINLEMTQKKSQNALRLIKHTKIYGMKLKQFST